MTLRPERSYFPSNEPGLGPVSRYFEGEATSEVGPARRAAARLLDGRLPDMEPLEAIIRRGDAVFKQARRRCPRRSARRRSARRCAGWSPATAATRPPVTFRVLVSPLVTWIWLGALIVFLGGLISSVAGAGGRPPPRRRRPTPRGSARELGRA